MSSIILDDFTSGKEKEAIVLDLEAFVAQHGSMHRPIALVSSGGTAADLERRSVRCLENFSTGLRGAVSVEGFLQRGYAVIHLWRQGSAAPFARVLSQQLGLAPNSALDTTALTRLFATKGAAGHDEEDDVDGEDESMRHVLRNDDPWLTKSDFDGRGRDTLKVDEPYSSFGDSVRLSRATRHSAQIQKVLREYKTVTRENRLLTISFRTVEEYLAKLQLCAEAIHPCQSLALTYLAAAVSDFYIPLAERAEHKIQSSEISSSDNGLTLHLKPVPKTIGLLRTKWAPSAFCVSFKLETDYTLLRQKAERAVEAYGVHLVIGNLLETRNEKVWILTPECQRHKKPESANTWQFEELSKTSPTDELEDLILDKVVEAHFEYISWTIPSDGVEAAREAQEALKQKKRQVQNQLYWKRVNAIGTEVAGYLLSGLLSWAVAVAIQRLRRSG
ncbi:hypothetical protein ACA910_016652 [Epithemia clementina (nom. ined.)]